MWSTAIVSGGEVKAVDLERGIDTKGTAVDRCIVGDVASTPSCIARVVTGFREEEEMQ